MARSTRKRSKPSKPLTTAQQLGSIIKSARDIMRKDRGLSGDTDRLPMLTWIMFLKFLDDMEQERETAVVLAEREFRPAIEPPYRWRDWAADEKGITGDDLIAFLNHDEAVRPDGTRGPGLFAYLRSLQGAEGIGPLRVDDDGPGGSRTDTTERDTVGLAEQEVRPHQREKIQYPTS